MIRSVAVVQRASLEACPRAAAMAVIVICTPGCNIPVRPDLRSLRLSFDTVAGELEAAASRLVHAAAAVPFAIAHARSIAAFAAALQLDQRELDLLVCESDGSSRSVTVARWLARQLGCPAHEAAAAAGIASCAMMAAVLRDLAPLAPMVGCHRAAPAAEPALQP